MNSFSIKSLAIAAGIGVSMVAGWKLTARAAYESAEYEVIEKDGPIEIRKYPELVLVTTPTRFERQGKDGSFMRLFRYISGANTTKQKVAMTTPVFMSSGDDQTTGRMAFVIPKQVADKGAPRPAGDRVELQRRAGGRFAVIRFSGRLNSDSYSKAEKKLRAWLAERGIQAEAASETAGYDPPWTPGPLRRNEVLIRL